MSDIGFHGLLAGLVGFLMLAAAGAGLVVESWIWFRARGRNGRSSGLPFLGPAAYAVVAVAVLLLADRGSLDVKETLDVAAPVVAGAGLALWLGVRIAAGRRRSARAGARLRPT